MRERQAVTKAMEKRYKKASKLEKGRMLDEFCELTGYRRSYAARVLRQGVKPKKPRRPGRPRKNEKKRDRTPKYGEDVREALIKIWVVTGCICTKRLHPFIPDLLGRLEACEEMDLAEDLRGKLLSVSPATMDRLLAPKRKELQVGKGRRGTTPGTLIKHQVPVRTFADWNEQTPGFFETDTVSHDGGWPTGGTFITSICAVDVCTSWVELGAVVNKKAGPVKEELERMRQACPLPFKGIDSDGGGEFINHTLIGWCKEHEITFTRSRPWRKNDSCYVEQKNGSVVRRYAGYAMHDSPEELELLKELYLYVRLHVNFFCPSAKLIEKTREGSRVKKRYDIAQTPFQRILANGDVPDATKHALKAEYQSLNPVDLMRLITELQLQLTELSSFKNMAGPRKELLARVTTSHHAASVCRQQSVVKL